MKPAQKKALLPSKALIQSFALKGQTASSMGKRQGLFTCILRRESQILLSNSHESSCTERSLSLLEVCFEPGQRPLEPLRLADHFLAVRRVSLHMANLDVGELPREADHFRQASPRRRIWFRHGIPAEHPYKTFENTNARRAKPCRS